MAWKLRWPVLAGFLLLLAGCPGFLAYALSRPQAWGAWTLAALGGHALDLAAAALVFVGGAGLGRLVLPDRRLAALSALESFLLRLAAGETLLGFCVAAMGWAGLLRPRPLWLLAPALCATAALEIRRWRPGLRRLTRLEAASLAVLVAALARGALAAAAPSADWDSLGYHLALPKIYLREGAFRHQPWTMYSCFPHGAEMLNLLLLSWRSSQAAQWLNWLHGAALLSATWALARRFFRPEAALAAAAVLAVQPPFQRVLGTAKSDPYAALAAVLAFSLAVLARKQKRADLFFLSGLAAGAAAGFKLSGLWAAASVLVLAAFSGARTFGAAACGAALLGAFWYARNAAWTGNPVWPFLGQLFGASSSDLAAWHRLRASDTGGIARTWLNAALLPWHLVFSSERFTSPIPFFSAAFLLLAAAKRRWARAKEPALPSFGTLSAVYLGAWFYVSQDGRYLLPAIAVGAALAASWAVELRAKPGLARVFAWLLLLGLVPAASLTANNELFPFFGFRPSSGGSARERYLELTLGAPYAAMRESNRILPADAKVALLREPRGYPMDRDYAVISPLDPGPVDFAGLTGGEALRGRLLALGFTHALYNPTIGDYQGDAAYYGRAREAMEELARARPPLAAWGPLALIDLRLKSEKVSSGTVRSRPL